MSLSIPPVEQQYYDLQVRDFGMGPCLATVHGGATIVLIADSSRRDAKACMKACDARGLLSAEAAVQVLQVIAQLWNVRAARLRADRATLPAEKEMVR